MVAVVVTGLTLDGPGQAGRARLTPERRLAIGDETLHDGRVLVHDCSWCRDSGWGNGRRGALARRLTRRSEGLLDRAVRQQGAPGAPAMRSNMLAFVVSIGLTSSARRDAVRRSTGAIQAWAPRVDQAIYALPSGAATPTKMQG